MATFAIRDQLWLLHERLDHGEVVGVDQEEAVDARAREALARILES